MAFLTNILAWIFSVRSFAIASCSHPFLIHGVSTPYIITGCGVRCDQAWYPSDFQEGESQYKTQPVLAEVTRWGNEAIGIGSSLLKMRWRSTLLMEIPFST